MVCKVFTYGADGRASSPGNAVAKHPVIFFVGRV